MASRFTDVSSNLVSNLAAALREFEVLGLTERLIEVAQLLRRLEDDQLAVRALSQDPRRKAAALYRDRRRRDKLLGGMHGEPAWDMLLDLFAQPRRIQVSSACIASAGPQTSALRHLNGLEVAGLVERVDDPHDRRRVLVGLTAAGDAVMRDYLGDATAV